MVRPFDMLLSTADTTTNYWETSCWIFWGQTILFAFGYMSRLSSLATPLFVLLDCLCGRSMQLEHFGYAHVACLLKDADMLAVERWFQWSWLEEGGDQSAADQEQHAVETEQQKEWFVLVKCCIFFTDCPVVPSVQYICWKWPEYTTVCNVTSSSAMAERPRDACSSTVGVFRRGCVTLWLWAQILDRRGCRPPTTVGVRKLEWLPFRMVSKYPQCIAWFCHKTRVWQTNGQNCDFQDRASIAASRGKKYA